MSLSLEICQSIGSQSVGNGITNEISLADRHMMLEYNKNQMGKISADRQRADRVRIKTEQAIDEAWEKNR